jgi:hypothetical protein
MKKTLLISAHASRTRETITLKGQCHEVFRLHCFIKQLLVIPIDTPKKYIKLCRIFADLFVFIIDLLRYTHHRLSIKIGGNKQHAECQHRRVELRHVCLDPEKLLKKTDIEIS